LHQLNVKHSTVGLTLLLLLFFLLPCRPRAVKLVAVLVALLTPQVVHDVMALLKACFTDERINR
jgi:hypothetical protein